MDKFNKLKLFLYNNKKRIIVISCLVMIFLTMTFIFLKTDKFKTNKVEYESLLEEKEITVSLNEDEEIDKVYYFVDVKGYVNNPGVYSLEKGMRVIDAINKAGGLKKDASTSLLNLSMEITDEMVIVVYSNTEIANLKEIKKEKNETDVICTENIINDACICNNDTKVNGIGEDNIENSESSNNKVININKATLLDLMTLPNIGENKAKSIIEYREKNGLFTKIEDIKNVSGIGDKLFETIKEYLAV